MTHYSQIPEKPLTAGMSEKFEPAQAVFFLEGSDGNMIYVGNNDAWELLSGRIQVLGSGKKTFKLIGTGNGKIFSQYRAEAQKLGQEDIKKAQEHLKAGVQAELEACRGNIIMPINPDKMGNGASQI